jgi:hypothetical protein
MAAPMQQSSPPFSCSFPRSAALSPAGAPEKTGPIASCSSEMKARSFMRRLPLSEVEEEEEVFVQSRRLALSLSFLFSSFEEPFLLFLASNASTQAGVTPERDQPAER